MYGGALFGVRLSFAQDLAGDRGGVTLAEEDVADEVHDRVSLRPAEVAVWPLAGRVAHVEEKGGDGVRYDRALQAYHPVAPNLYAPHLQDVLKLRRVVHVHL